MQRRGESECGDKCDMPVCNLPSSRIDNLQTSVSETIGEGRATSLCVELELVPHFFASTHPTD